MSYGEKCHCRHAMRSHNSLFYGQRHYRDCRYCGCLFYVPKSSEKSTWEELHGTLWKKAGEAQRAHNHAVHEATKVFNKTKRETGKEDHVTFWAALAPTQEAYDKAYAAAKEEAIRTAEGG